MKKTLVLLTAGLMTLALATAQTPSPASKRLVLVEEFTNTGCGPCASWSPVLDSAINYRLGDCIAIKYHSGYPDKNDEFYLYDQEVQQAKVDYYNVTGVPTTFVNGIEIADRSFAYMNTAIDYCLKEQPQDYDIELTKELVGHQLKVSVYGMQNLYSENPTISEPNENVRLNVAVIEEHLERSTPFSNGESELNYTLRKMLTGPNGNVVFNGLTSFHVESEWTDDCFDDISQLGVVAFLQNIETREILCTAYSGPNAEGENRLALMNFFDTPDLICVPNFYGKVLFRNDGANTITSATLNVRVNGSVKQYPWTGELNYLDRDTLAFSDFTNFDLVEAGSNRAEVWFSDINGSTSESNVRSKSFSNSVVLNYGAQLKIYTDKKPEEITWNLYNSAGDLLQHGGPYTESRKFITIPLEVTVDDCYQIEFLDAGGDGIKGSYGNGYYQLFQVDENGKTARVTQGDYDGASFYLNFRLTGSPVVQTPRLVLFEEFTNTSCDPCAEFSPALDNTIYESMGQMVAITYHWNFPSPTDPFYLVSSDDVMARANYYGVTGVPSLRVDGEHVRAWGYDEYLPLYVSGAANVAAKMNIDTRAHLSDDDVLTVDVALSPIGVTDGQNLRLFAAAVEERIEWDEPAANGERSWNYVLRKLLTGADGQALEAELNKVTPYNYEFSWKVENFTDPTELGIVTFVQDISTGEIFNAAYTPRPTGSDSAAKILQVLNTPDRICTPLFTSDLSVRNIGRDALTSATINVRINGTLQQTPWTGRMNYLDIQTLRTPAFENFTLADNQDNEVEIWLSDLNGTTEESVHKSFKMKNAYHARNAVRLTIMTDQQPGEITWTLTNSAGDVVAQGGPYAEARKKQVVDLPLSLDDCYMLEFEDAGGDGIAGGRGYYTLHEVDANGKSRLLVQQTYEEALHDVFFSLQNAATQGIETVTGPASSSAEVYDLQGRQVKHPATGLYIKNSKKIIQK